MLNWSASSNRAAALVQVAPLEPCGWGEALGWRLEMPECCSQSGAFLSGEVSPRVFTHVCFPVCSMRASHLCKAGVLPYQTYVCVCIGKCYLICFKRIKIGVVVNFAHISPWHTSMRDRISHCQRARGTCCTWADVGSFSVKQGMGTAALCLCLGAL